MEVVDDRLENNGKHCSTIDPVNVKKEMEHDEYYPHDIVHQPENMENQTSDIITSVQLEENVERVLDSKGRNDKMEGRKAERQKGKMTSDEREVLIWNRENTSTEVAELDDHGLPTPCPQLIAHHDTDMEVIDDRLENIEKQNVTNTVNNINHVSVKEEPKSDDDYTHDLPSRPVNTCDGNTENERSDIITSGTLEENRERVIESGGKSGKMEEKHKESEEVEMSVEEEEDVCQKQENSLSDIADKQEHAENMSRRKQSDSKHKSTERRHGQKKEKQGKFQCDVCGYSTNDKSHLTKHKRIHTKEKPFTCEVCGYSASQKSSLIRHKRKHSGDMPFKCITCSVEFSRTSHLCRHTITQHEQNPPLFRCSFCRFSSRNKQTTKSHEIHIHTKEYPHECKVCKMGFITPSALQKHMITKHKQK